MPAAWRSLCTQAKAAWAAGRKQEARRLARHAAQLAPQREEPWLLLASMAGPAASRAYYEEALRINPRSQPARAGLRQAGGALALPRLGSPALLALAALTAGFALFAWLRPPSVDQNLRYLGAAAAQGIDSLLASSTPTHTATVTASLTPSATYTPTPTHTPTFTATFSPTATATAGADTSGLEKYHVEQPRGIDPSERWIDVNLSKQTLEAYEGSTLVRSFVISSGRGGTPTVTGVFRIWVKVRMQDMSGPGYYIRDVPWVMYFYGDYGIHGTWWHNNFGTPMSAGCVNMTVADAQWMYSWASVGTVVQVHY